MQRLYDLCSHPRSLYGAAILRIGYGAVAVALHLVNYTDRRYLWGPSAVYPFRDFENSLVRPAFSLYELSSSEPFFELVFHAGLAVAVLFLLGIGGRLTNVLHFVFLWSLYSRNTILLDGGDNLAYLVLFFFMFVNGSEKLSLRRRDREISQVASLMHNMALLCIIVQLCLLYVNSALYKVQGQLWQDGTAIYYILNVPEFNWPVLTDHIVRQAWLVTAMTYFTVYFQLSFVPLIANRQTRVLAVALGIVFHTGIAVLMGLTSFSVYIISAEAVILSDSHYEKVKIWMDRRLSRSRNFSPIAEEASRVTG